MKNSPVRTTKGISKFFAALDGFCAPLATAVGARLFVYPRRYKLRGSERSLIGEGTRLRVYSNGKPINGWRWGNGPAVLLVHGWSAGAGQFAKIIEQITSMGYSAIAFDMPAHGCSPGKSTTLIGFAEAISAISRSYGPFHTIVAHSLGSLATAIAMVREDNRLAKNLVLISPLTGSVHALERFSDMIGISEDTSLRIQRKFEEQLNIKFSDCCFPELIDRIEIPMLVLQDKQDTWVSWEETKQWADKAENVKMISTDGLGHQRIVSDHKVIEEISEFIGMPKANIREQFLSEAAL